MSNDTVVIGANAADMTEVATRLAAVCDMIEEHRKSGTAICVRRATAICAMINDVAAAAAEGRPTTTGSGDGRKRPRMESACSYEEVDELGVGLSGFVVRGRHRATGEDVALKSLHREGCGVGGGIGRLLREACFMAAFRGHPFLVALRGVVRVPGVAADGDDDDDYSLVMDYVGPSLLDVLRARGRPFTEPNVRVAMRQLLAGAEAMHRHRIVHRDIKSENILVAVGGGAVSVRICDFGSAKSTAEQSPPGQIAGTMEYMAPEVLVRNADHGVPADAWSLGCVMAELLTRELPFRGEDMADQLREIFDVLGVPDERAWEAMRPRVLAGEVKQWRAQKRRVGHGNRLRELIPEEVLSDDGFEVLKGLLTCDPEKRMTAAAALRCAWFADMVEDACVCVPAASAVSMIDATGKRGHLL
uniref:[RNA-polymerase]-subunit kinase n=3 Tax=Setaria italica TaxID=4555 RepID=K3ZF01_SETIT